MHAASANRFQNIEKSRKIYTALEIGPFDILDKESLNFLRLNTD